MLEKHPYVKIFLKVIACFLIAASITILTTFLIRKFYEEPTDPSPPPPCLLECKNGGICINNHCRCSEYYTGELCTIENFCKPDSICDNSSKCYEFDSILVGMYSYSKELCENTTVNANTPQATVQCVNNGGILSFGPIRLQNCDENLETLANKTHIDTENAESVAATAQILTSEPTSLQAEDITNAIRIVNRLLTLSNATEEVGQSAVATVSQILSANETEFKDDEVQVNEAESLTRQMEAYSLNVVNDTVSMVQRSVAVEKRTLSARNQNGIQFMSLKGLPGGEEDLISNRVIVDNNTSEFVHNETADVQLFIKPSESVDINIAVGFVLYQNDNLFKSIHKRALTYRKRVISANISSGIHANVEFSFSQRSDPSFILVQYACVYWDYDKSEWNTEGCKKLSTVNDASALRCACNHTTNFAVLMNFRENITHPELGTVSTAGCVLSMVGLTVTVVFLLYASCWLAGVNEQLKLDLSKPLLWSFLLPVGIILIANICIFIAVAVSIWKKNPNVTSTKKHSVLKKTLATVSVSTLLGVTWIVGFLMLIETRESTQIIFSYIFCLCCATQGLQIFIFYTLKSPLFLEKVAVGIRLFNSCKLYMHSDKYWVNRIQKEKTQLYNEQFRNVSESTAQLFSDSKKE
ncbi:adhesion G-protein coupled receptor G7 isoform X3 [Rana temporaria]|uniref:adhesion G-protein coupled receptor G7 isoform X3 n=1 Tax=Rana temporaria TaxID=8407 RepID=UPI001AAE162E|nr:adhesion G-protein coupled receptor G7 isoform X3 [Rana temporaria]